MHLANRAHLAKQLCTAAIFGLTLASVLDRAEVDRDLDVLELRCGVGSSVQAGVQVVLQRQGIRYKEFRT